MYFKHIFLFFINWHFQAEVKKSKLLLGKAGIIKDDGEEEEV